MPASRRCLNPDAYPLDPTGSGGFREHQTLPRYSSPAFSISTVRKLYEGVRTLKRMPELGREGLRAGTRELVMHPLPYIVVYRVRSDAVEILRIWHGAQDRTAG